MAIGQLSFFPLFACIAYQMDKEMQWSLLTAYIHISTQESSENVWSLGGYSGEYNLYYVYLP